MSSQTLLLFDLDGVVQFDRRVDADAAALLGELRQAGYVLRFLTNDGFNSRHSRLAELRADGLEVAEHELYTASSLAARYAATRGTTFVLGSDLAAAEFADVPQDPLTARTVVIGDWFHHYDRERLQLAFEAVLRGAEMIAVHKKRAWTHQGRRLIDVGFFVAGLEHCSGRAATVVGKPAAFAYRTVLEDAGFAPEHAVMISDEPEPDLQGAQACGLRTLLLGDAEGMPGEFAPHTLADLRRALLG
ncbi:MAG: HAD hydrolase-like protein [Planctomycetota bacterium]